jgi:hypothetical protein
VTSIGKQRLDRSPFDGGQEFVNAFAGGEVSLHGVHGRAVGAKMLRRLVDLWLVGSDYKVKAVLDTEFGQFITDTAGGAGED